MARGFDVDYDPAMPPPAYTPRKRLVMQVTLWAVFGVTLAAASVARPLVRPQTPEDRLRQLLEQGGGSAGDPGARPVGRASAGRDELRQFGPVVLRVPAGWTAFSPDELAASDPGDEYELPPGTVAVLQETSALTSLLADRGSVRTALVTLERAGDGGGTGHAATAPPTPADVLRDRYPPESRTATWAARIGDYPAEAIEIDQAAPDRSQPAPARAPRRATPRYYVVCAVTPAGRIVTVTMFAAGTDPDADRALLDRIAAGAVVVE